MARVAVVGAGIVGITTAHALVEAGHEVVLIDRAPAPGTGASYANGGQLSYRYVSPLADAGVPLKALRWLLERGGPLRLRPDGTLAQWRWLAAFLRHCTGAQNRRATERLLALGALSQRRFEVLQLDTTLADAIDLRTPGKLVLYRDADDFRRVRARTVAGPEQALSAAECLAIEPALSQTAAVNWLAGGIFTPGEAVADCFGVCRALLGRLAGHPRFEAALGTTVTALQAKGGRLRGLRTSHGDLVADAYVLAAGLQSAELAAAIGLRLPLYPLKGYSLTAPIGPAHVAPQVSVTDFERKTVYARIGNQLRVAAMVDLVGDDVGLDPRRLASLQRNVRSTFPLAADYDHAVPWAGLRPATPSGAPMLGPTRWSNLWLNVGHGALGFTFSFGAAHILAEMVSGRASPISLEGLRLRGA